MSKISDYNFKVPVGTIRYNINGNSVYQGYLKSNNVYQKAVYQSLYSIVGNIKDDPLYNFPLLTTNVINCGKVSYGANLYVTIGIGGIRTTPNLVSWTDRTSNTSNTLTDNLFKNNTFIVTATRGTLLTSTNGIDWIKRNTNSSYSLHKAEFGANTFVVVGSNGVILTSNNSVDWTQVNSNTTNAINEIIYDGNKFIYAGANVVGTSTDAVTWNTQNISIVAHSLSYGNNVYVMSPATSNTLYVSNDAVTWSNVTPYPLSHLVADITFGDGLFMATTGGGSYCRINRSLDGVNWVHYPDVIQFLGPITYYNNMFLFTSLSSNIYTITPYSYDSDSYFITPDFNRLLSNNYTILPTPTFYIKY